MKTTTPSVNHTTGPWHVGMKPGPIVYGTMGEQVASLHVAMVPQEENKANARLIAAAPDLLVACITALDTLGDEYKAGDKPTAKILRTAIAKAEGRAQ